MTNSSGGAGDRTVVCARCGASFGCSLSGECWCASEPVRLAVPAKTDNASSQAEDCLCLNCLREVAEEQARANRNAASSR